MNINKLLIPVICGLALGLGACGGDSATEAEPVVSPFGGGDQPPVSAGVLSSTILSSASVPPVSNGQTAPLASAANLSIPANLYVSWLTYHYVTLESESSYYGSIASGFGHVFSAAYQPAARIIWSSAQSTPYSAQCKVDDTTMPIMKFRGCTVSEGIGYGMLISAMQGDEPTFVTLWNYSRAFRAYNGNQPLTPWITFSFHFNEIDLGSATDADLDIATSLILMYLKTTNVAYLNDALVIAGGIWDKEVKDNKLLSGDTRMWDGTKGPIVYNLSYFSPVALRLFAKYDTAHNWTAVLDAMYSYMAAIQAAGTGVFPDWSTETSSVNPPNDAAGNEKSGFTYYTFNKESVRIPWRIAWDYYWFQDPRALAVLQTLNQFITSRAGNDPTSAALAVNYSWNLSIGPDNTRNTAVPAQWLAAWCATGIGTNSTWLESCTKALNGKTVSTPASSYFPDILLVMYSQLLNGQYTRPAGI